MNLIIGIVVCMILWLGLGRLSVGPKDQTDGWVLYLLMILLGPLYLPVLWLLTSILALSDTEDDEP